MSYCAIVTFEGDCPTSEIEFRNSWGGSAYIWTCLYDKYLKNPAKEFDSWLAACTTGSKRLWELADNHALSEMERRILLATFDNALILKSEFRMFAFDLRAFVKMYPPRNVVCHLNDWAKWLDEDETADCIGFYGTSVGENTWFPYEEGEEERRPYNLKTDTKHFYVYDYKLGEVAK